MSFSQNGAEAFSTTAQRTYFKETVTWARNKGWHSYIKSIAPKAVEGISPEKARQLREKRAAEQAAKEAAGMNVEDTLHEMQLHEWASEQRLEILEVKLRDKILEKITLVEEAVKYGMDSALFERLQVDRGAYGKRARSTGRASTTTQVAASTRANGTSKKKAVDRDITS
jgi:hypothetical protein